MMRVAHGFVEAAQETGPHPQKEKGGPFKARPDSDGLPQQASLDRPFRRLDSPREGLALRLGTSLSPPVSALPDGAQADDNLDSEPCKLRNPRTDVS